MTDLVAVLTAELAANPTGNCTLVIGASSDTIPTAVLAAAFGIKVAPVILPPAPKILYQAKVNTALLNVRAGGSTSAAVLGQLKIGDVVDVYSDTVIVTAAHTW